MPMVQLDFDQEVVNRIRSIYRTLDNYRRTSMALHGRLIDSVSIYAEQRRSEVLAIASKWPDSERIQREAGKFEAYLEHHKLRIDNQV